MTKQNQSLNYSSPKWFLFASRFKLIFEREFRKLWYLYLDNLPGLKINRLLVIGNENTCRMYIPPHDDDANFLKISADYKKILGGEYFMKFKKFVNKYEVTDDELGSLMKNSQNLGPCLICGYYIERLLTQKIKDKNINNTELKRIKQIAMKNGAFRNKVLQILDEDFSKLSASYRKKDINWYTIGEVQEGLKSQTIWDRKKFYVAILTKKNSTILTGAKALRFFKKEGFKTEKLVEFKHCQGVPAYRGKVIGRVFVANNFRNLSSVKNKILVTFMTQPQYDLYFKRQKAFVTDEGGITCHAAIAAREFKIPCIVGTKIATRVFKTGDLVEVDANKGIVKLLKSA